MLQISDFLDQWINAQIFTFVLAVVSIKAVGHPLDIAAKNDGLGD